MDLREIFKGCVCAGFPSVLSRENSLGRKLALEPDRILGRSSCNFMDYVELFGGFKCMQLEGNERGAPISRCRCDSEKVDKFCSFFFLILYQLCE